MKKIKKKVVETIKRHPVVIIAVGLSFLVSVISFLIRRSTPLKSCDFNEFDEDDMEFDGL